jgi:uncharacterized RDD family membrane protein YckC
MSEPGIRRTAAHPWRRLMCVAYEGILLFGVLFFFGYAFSSFAQFKGQPGLVRWIFQGFITLVLAIYFAWSWADGRRTLPMKTMSVRLETSDGRNVTAARALARFVAALAMIVIAIAAGSALHPSLYLLLLAPYLSTLVDRDHRALYDLAAGTRLVNAQRDDL